MANPNIWQETEEQVDLLFAESDTRLFNLLHQIAKLAMETLPEKEVNGRHT